MDQQVQKLDRLLVSETNLGPLWFDRLRIAQQELGLLQGNRTTCFVLRPHILRRDQYDSVCRVAESLARSFEKLTNEAFINPPVLELLDLTPAEEEMARIDPGYERLCVTSRLDAYITPEGFEFLEYNAETPAGVGDQVQLEKLLFRLPVMKSFLETNEHWLPRPHRALLKSLLETYRAWGGEEEKPQIAIIDWEGVPTSSEFYILREYFVRHGCPSIIADPHDLQYDGDRLTVDGFRVDILYKRVIIHEFLNKFDKTHPLIRAYKDGSVCLANSFRTKLAHKKSSFAVLSDPWFEGLFEAEEVDVFRRHIPWTRYVRPSRTIFQNVERDLISLLREERERFVLKPNDDYGGHGVFLGWELTADEWEIALRMATQQPYVVQERVRLERSVIPTFSDCATLEEVFVDFNPFLFQNKVEGALIRTSHSSLLNVSSGGGQTALLILEELRQKGQLGCEFPE